MGNEAQVALVSKFAQLLFNLRLMAMPRCAIGTHAVVGAYEIRRIAPALASPRNPGLSVNHHI